MPEYKTGIYGVWVWRVPPGTSMAVVLALAAIGEFPPPRTEGWNLVVLEYGRFKSIEEAMYLVPKYPSTYVIAIGKGDTMEWEIKEVK